MVQDSNPARNLQKEHSLKKKEIRARLKEFEKNFSKSDRKIFMELCFCLFTPQSNALKCDAAIKSLEKENLILKGSAGQISKKIPGVRFRNNKSRYLVEARNFFSNPKTKKIEIKKIFKKSNLHGFSKKSAFALREFLVKNIKGLGYKEATHFLRNIGLGKNLAILDRHILKNLKKFNAIKEIPKALSRKNYLEIEKQMQSFSKKAKIPVEELDLLFWSKETGKIFK